MKIIVFIIGMLTYTAQAQQLNYIGMSKTDIVSSMQKNNPGFDLDEGAVNSAYKYIKFVDKYNEETYLFFMDENNSCSFTKLMSDYSNLKIRTDELNKNYKNAGEGKWIYVENGVVYIIEMKKEEWFFTIIMKKKKLA
jgi:hypothetical protein